MADIQTCVDALLLLDAKSVFHDLPRDQLVALLESAEVLKLNPGDYILREGDESSFLFFSTEGEVELDSAIAWLPAYDASMPRASLTNRLLCQSAVAPSFPAG